MNTGQQLESTWAGYMLNNSRLRSFQGLFCVKRKLRNKNGTVVIERSVMMENTIKNRATHASPLIEQLMLHFEPRVLN